MVFGRVVFANLPGSPGQRVLGVEGEIQLEYIDAGFAEYAEITASSVLADQLAERVFTHTASGCHAGNLEIRRGRRYMGVQAGC